MSTRSKAKVSTCNNILCQLTCSQWGSNPYTLRTSALALCFSAAEYECPVWTRSAHARLVHSVLNDSCFKPTKTNCFYILSGITLPDIRREMANRMERYKAEHNSKHLLYGRKSPTQCLKIRNCFLSSTLSLTFPWRKHAAPLKKTATMLTPTKTLY